MSPCRPFRLVPGASIPPLPPVFRPKVNFSLIRLYVCKDENRNVRTTGTRSSQTHDLVALNLISELILHTKKNLPVRGGVDQITPKSFRR
ncbi:hypothetical protein AVEN_82656-1 [Araneus ventricosus]|uniref:Uncharacterized protein n=1 Tax=Araneus ventricosus TaxID=182803 RepID=A0A4Y2QS91_ARAVE|nr:hypothetical protein AVEN_82656-1 [Araneus ventricosus]